jgi:hypothetical protein
MTRPMEGRNGQIYREYLLGSTQEAIAAKHGIGQQRVSEIVLAVRAGIPETDLAEAKVKHLDVMDLLADTMAELMEAPLPPAYSNGRPIYDEDGTMVRDFGPRMAAADRLVKINERVAKVLGLDAPVKADVTVSEQADRVAEAAAAEALARMAADTQE